MSRPKAGTAWRAKFNRDGKAVWELRNDGGEWVPSGSACGWPRCQRCRRPHDSGSALCPQCVRTLRYRALSVTATL